MNMAHTVAGFLVGGVVGMTGIGGGSLMTPILMLLFGHTPQTAVGTDLLFACVTKSVGWTIHDRNGTVDRQVLYRLLWGSIPVAVIANLYIHFHPLAPHEGRWLVALVGAAIIPTAIGLFCKPLLLRPSLALHPATQAFFMKYQVAFTIAAGVVVGAMVSLTSVGAGALGTLMLVYLYPLRMKAAHLVGTDITHAIPLTLVAGIGHLLNGNANLPLLANLLTGSIPGIIIGSLIVTRLPEAPVRNLLAAVLLLMGLKMVVA